MSLTEFWEQVVLLHLQKTVKPLTLHGYMQIWSSHLSLELAPYKLTEYKTVDATRFLTRLAERGLSTRTIAHTRSLLSSLFKHAVQTGRIEVNPVRDAGSLVPAQKTAETHAYTLDECERIVTALVGNIEAQLVFTLACFLGLRPGEIAGLRWDDIDSDWIHVRRSSGRGITGTTKTEESVASVPLIFLVRELLVAWRLQAQSEWVFPSSRGDRPMNISQFAQRVIAPLLKSKNIAWHGLYAGRRGAATLLVQLTGNAVASQCVLRHKNMATTTAHYIKPSRQAAVDGLRLLEAKLLESKDGKTTSEVGE